MNRATPIPCAICKASLEEVDDASENQPYGGNTFETHGSYGSTTFDPMDGSFLEIIVCDPCLTSLQAQGHVMNGRDKRPVIDGGSLVGFEAVTRPLVPWNGSSEGDFTVDVSAPPI